MTNTINAAAILSNATPVTAMSINSVRSSLLGTKKDGSLYFAGTKGCDGRYATAKVYNSFANHVEAYMTGGDSAATFEALCSAIQSIYQDIVEPAEIRKFAARLMPAMVKFAPSKKAFSVSKGGALRTFLLHPEYLTAYELPAIAREKTERAKRVTKSAEQKAQEKADKAEAQIAETYGMTLDEYRASMKAFFETLAAAKADAAAESAIA